MGQRQPNAESFIPWQAWPQLSFVQIKLEGALLGILRVGAWSGHFQSNRRPRSIRRPSEHMEVPAVVLPVPTQSLPTAHTTMTTDTTTIYTRTRNKTGTRRDACCLSSLSNMRRPARPQASGRRVLVVVLPVLLLLAMGPGQAVATTAEQRTGMKVCTCRCSTPASPPTSPSDPSYPTCIPHKPLMQTHTEPEADSGRHPRQDL